MNKKAFRLQTSGRVITSIGSILIAFFAIHGLALATSITLPNDVPPGAMSYGNVSQNALPADPNIIAAIIGVVGLLMGSFITIVATYFIRWMDIRREDKREKLLMEKNRREKVFQMKQEVYRTFLNELSNLEAFVQPDFATFKRDLTKTDIKLDLIASDKVREINENLKNILLLIAEKNYKSKSIELSEEYLNQRENLLEAIRSDIDLNQIK